MEVRTFDLFSGWSRKLKTPPFSILNLCVYKQLAYILNSLNPFYALFGSNARL